jgi:hypothetical protein
MMTFSKMENSRAATVLLALCSSFLGPTAFATTKGLSQIVTPDLQKEGELSLSFQWQDKHIANPFEFQAELGVTKWLELGSVSRIEAFRADFRW